MLNLGTCKRKNLIFNFIDDQMICRLCRRSNTGVGELLTHFVFKKSKTIWCEEKWSYM